MFRLPVHVRKMLAVCAADSEFCSLVRHIGSGGGLLRVVPDSGPTSFGSTCVRLRLQRFLNVLARPPTRRAHARDAPLEVRLEGPT